MDWFLYDNGLRHERVKDLSDPGNLLKVNRLIKVNTANCIHKVQNMYEKRVKLNKIS